MMQEAHSAKNGSIAAESRWWRGAVGGGILGAGRQFVNSVFHSITSSWTSNTFGQRLLQIPSIGAAASTGSRRTSGSSR